MYALAGATGVQVWKNCPTGASFQSSVAIGEDGSIVVANFLDDVFRWV